MKLLMDADCLIKLTKAGLKGLVAENNVLFIPAVVKREVVDTGIDKGCTDAFMVKEDIQAKKVTVVESAVEYPDGDEALIGLFQADRYDAVATDDAKLARKFRMHGTPYILPALILYRMWRHELIARHVALRSLEQLAELISEEEYSTAKLMMEGEV